jgi:hypothetical protein
MHWDYFGYLDPRVTFCLLARLAGTPKLGLAPLPNPLRVGRATIIAPPSLRFSSVIRAFLERFFEYFRPFLGM